MCSRHFWSLKVLAIVKFRVYPKQWMYMLYFTLWQVERWLHSCYWAYFIHSPNTACDCWQAAHSSSWLDCLHQLIPFHRPIKSSWSCRFSSTHHMPMVNYLLVCYFNVLIWQESIPSAFLDSVANLLQDLDCHNFRHHFGFHDKCIRLFSFSVMHLTVVYFSLLQLTYM